MATEYSKKTNAELVEILKSRSLPHTGKKADLVARLQEADKADAEKAAAASATATTTETATKVDVEDVIDWDDDDTPTVEPVTSKTNTTTDTTVKAAATDTKNDTTTTEAAVATETPAVAPEPTPAEAPAKEPENKAEATTGVAEGGETDSAPQAEEKPATDYTMGLSSTDFEAELAKRKARAEKFGTVEDAATASEEAKKSVERAKRFGTATEGGSTVGVKGLDEALSSDRPRKRGRGGDDEDGARGGKRTDFGGRGRGRWGRRGQRNNGGHGGRRGGNQRNDNRPANDNNKGNGKPSWSEQDVAAMEKRKARFATAA